MKDNRDGKDKVTVPSVSSVTVIWFEVPPIQEVKSETEAICFEALVERSLEAVREERVIFEETMRSVVEAVPETVIAVVEA